MPLVEDLKARIHVAVKEGDTVARDVLRLALGELQTHEARGGGALGEDAAQAVLRKLVKSNEETLTHATDDGAKAALRRENEVLSSLLPAALDVDGIVSALSPEHDAIRGAKADGPAVGLAMKALKAMGKTVVGSDVTAAVAKIRGR